MPKFREGDVVYCIRPSLDDTDTDFHCGLSKEMEPATTGFPMTVRAVGDNPEFQSYSLHSPQFGVYTQWWFHEDDLEFFNESFENK